MATKGYQQIGGGCAVMPGARKIARNIVWDTDGEHVDGLPSEQELPANLHPDDAADWLSDCYGFCILSLDLEDE